MSKVSLIVNGFKTFVLPKIVGWVLKLNLKQVLKEAIHEHALEAIEILKVHINSERVQDKKKEIVDYVINKVELPLLLKPFKGLLKKKLSTLIDEVVDDLLSNIEEKLS